VSEQDDQYTAERAIVATVQADMRAEDEANGKTLLQTLDSMPPTPNDVQHSTSPPQESRQHNGRRRRSSE
jgi:hypothetical protein